MQKVLTDEGIHNALVAKFGIHYEQSISVKKTAQAVRQIMLESTAIKQALEDSKRLQWLIDNDAYVLSHPFQRHQVVYNDKMTKEFDSARDAIDEARKDGKS